MGGRFLAALGRICLSVLFLVSAVLGILYWSDARGEVLSALSAWDLHSGSDTNPLIQTAASYPSLVLLIAIILQLIGGLFLLFSVRVRLGAFLLLLYMVPSVILHHHFWFLSGESMAFSLMLFLKGLAIIGGLLVVWGLGKGHCKPKPPKKEKEEFPLDSEHEEHTLSD